MKYWLLLISSFFSLFAFAEKVPLSKAENWAVRFFQQQTNTRSGNVQLDMVWNGEEGPSRTSSEPAFYVFNRTDQKGFVIVSGEDATNPLIGYSFTENFTMENLPANIKAWLMDRKQEVMHIRKHPSSALYVTKKMWTANTTDIGEVVKYIETAAWDQDTPYNDKCPIDPRSGERSVTGCTATCYAIALHARQWPDKGVGTVQSNKGAYIKLPDLVLGHTYQWDQMPMKLDVNSSPEAKEAVATLMYDCGIMAYSDYGSRGTGGMHQYCVRNMREHMKYSPEAEFEEREYLPTEKWLELIHKELEEYGPVIYGGITPQGSAHAFVIDGYTTNEYYSVNWGWGGKCNGYYLLSLLHPKEQGIGGSPVDEGFMNYQGAVFGMRKAEPGEVNTDYPNIRLTEHYVNHPELHQYFYGITPQSRDIQQGVEGVIQSISLLNQDTDPVDVEYTLAVFDKENEVKETISKIRHWEVGPLVMNIPFDTHFKITKAINPGDYMAVAYRPVGATEWKEMRGGHKTQTRIPLDGSDFACYGDKVVLSSGIHYDDVPWGIHATTENIVRNQEFDVETGAVTNVSTVPFDGIISVGLYDKNEKLKTKVSEMGYSLTPPLQPSKSGNATIYSCIIKDKIEEGDFLALCYRTKDNKNWERILPMYGVNGRIPLRTAEEQLVLEQHTSFTFNDKEDVIRLTTLQGTSVELLDANGTSISKVQADKDGKVELDVDKVAKGTYKLKLSLGEQVKEIQLVF